MTTYNYDYTNLSIFIILGLPLLLCYNKVTKLNNKDLNLLWSYNNNQ